MVRLFIVHQFKLRSLYLSDRANTWCVLKTCSSSEKSARVRIWKKATPLLQTVQVPLEVKNLQTKNFFQSSWMDFPVSLEISEASCCELSKNLTLSSNSDNLVPGSNLTRINSINFCLTTSNLLWKWVILFEKNNLSNSARVLLRMYMRITLNLNNFSWSHFFGWKKI